MEISNFFEREIQFIESEDFRDFVRWFFDEKVGAWFRKSFLMFGHHPLL